MFDDQSTNKQGTAVPSNLPTGEPEDIFAGTPIDEETPSVSVDTAEQTPDARVSNSAINSVASALGVGALKPKQPNAMQPNAMQQGTVDVPSRADMTVNNMSATEPGLSLTPDFSQDVNATREPRDLGEAQRFASDPVGQSQNPSMFERPAYGPTPPPPPVTNNRGMGGGSDENTSMLKEPIGSKRVMFFIVVAVALVVLIGGGAWAYFAFIATGDDTIGTFNTEPTGDFLDTDPDNANNPVDNNVPAATTTQTTDENIIFGDSIPDTDSDGLDDVREEDIGTDSLNWDTDGDELGDGDEVIIWKTNPLNPDTDGDGFADGTEVKNGYNPLGNGKLFEPPTNSASATATSTNANTTTSAATTSTGN